MNRFAFCSSVVLLLTLTGCVNDYANRPAQGSVYVVPQEVETTFVARDEYIYYPAYQVYYSDNRRQYVYREDNAWVARLTPTGVPVNTLRASPSVKMDFHDSPKYHDAAMAQKYPKNWPARGLNQGQNANPDQKR